jgi:hypothetical protein
VPKYPKESRWGILTPTDITLFVLFIIAPSPKKTNREKIFHPSPVVGRAI